MKFTKIKHNNSKFYLYEDKNITMGYTEISAEIEDVSKYLEANRIVQLQQVHGNKIYFSNEVKGYPEGDGIILSERGVLAVIRTADCVPLFFRTKDHRFAGIIHVGWRGLYSQIGINLLKLLKNEGINPEDLFFFTGPAIEGRCYTVRHNLVEKFKEFNYSKDIFEKTANGYSMDIIKGITMCLTSQGVSPENINHSEICTYCDKNLP